LRRTDSVGVGYEAGDKKLHTCWALTAAIA